MQIVVETERLILRQFLDSDVDDLVELDSDPAVMQFINGGRPTSRSVIEGKLLPMYLAQYSAGDQFGRWAAIEASNGAFLGFFHLRAAPQTPDEEPELGYRLHRSAWGYGYATEGCQALLDKGFAAWGAHRVVAQAMVVNLASRRVMEKLGMKPVRHFRMEWPDHIEGEEHGDVEYAITRKEWAQRRRR
ncbi:MAG: GNAT family N-acetyltransferase [Geodermatophilaceae bacterium]|nr:GNAT family N-acetyltransferase [Geodermatophilaceae bacterium]